MYKHVCGVVCHTSVHETCMQTMRREEKKGRLALDWMFFIGGADLICMAWQDSSEMWLPFLCFRCQPFALSIRFSFVASCPSTVKKHTFAWDNGCLAQVYLLVVALVFIINITAPWHFHGWNNQVERVVCETGHEKEVRLRRKKRGREQDIDMPREENMQYLHWSIQRAAKDTSNTLSPSN